MFLSLRLISLAPLLGLFGVASLSAQDTGATQKSNATKPAVAPQEAALRIRETVALEAVAVLEQNYEQAREFYASKVLKMRPGKKREKAQALYFPEPAEWGQRFLKQTASAPRSEAEARAWAWIARYAHETPLGPVAVAGLIEHHLDSPWIRLACEEGTSATEAQLYQIWETSRVGQARAYAGLELGRRLLNTKGKTEAMADERLKRGLALLEIVEKELAAVRVGSQLAGKLASEQLIVWRTLRPGMPSIPLTGVDLDGEAVLLKPHGGPSVYLFWTTRDMRRVSGYGLLRTLHKRFATRGVRFVGVNGDFNRARAAREAKLQRMPMQSLADGTQGGALAKTYQIGSWPQAVLVDAEGNLVRRGIAIRDLAAALDSYLE